MATLEKITDNEDGYGLYAMTVKYDYSIDDIIDSGYTDTQGFVDAVIKESLPLLPASIKVPSYGCSAFHTTTTDGNVLMDREYYDDFYAMMGDAGQNQLVSALLTNDRPDMHIVEADNRFTTNILYRLGFSWPFIDDDYLEIVITSLDTLDFFFMD